MSSYATVAGDLNVFTPAVTMMASISTQDQQQILDSVSSEFDDAIADQYTLPLVQLNGAWPLQLRANICYIAYYRMLFGRRGANPMSPGDEMWERQAEKAEKWIEEIASGKKQLTGCTDSAPDTIEGVPSMITSAQRGWTNRGNTATDPGTPFSADRPPRGSGSWSPDGWS